jgi:Flp pilus assembly protein TadG
MRRATNAVVLPDIPLTGSTTVRQRLRAAARRDDGATALEFAIVLPVVLTVVFFALYGALYFFYGAIADHVARSVARQVSIPVAQGGGDCPTYPDSNQATVTADAKSAAGTLIPDPTSVVPTSLPTATKPCEGDFVTITVTYKLPVLDQLASMIPGLSAIDTMTRSASERRQ